MPVRLQTPVTRPEIAAQAGSFERSSTAARPRYTNETTNDRLLRVVSSSAYAGIVNGQLVDTVTLAPEALGAAARLEADQAPIAGENIRLRGASVRSLSGDDVFDGDALVNPADEAPTADIEGSDGIVENVAAPREPQSLRPRPRPAAQAEPLKERVPLSTRRCSVEDPGMLEYREAVCVGFEVGESSPAVVGSGFDDLAAVAFDHGEDDST